MSKKNVYHLSDVANFRLRQIQKAFESPSPQLTLEVLISGTYEALVSSGKIIELDPDGGDAA